MTQPNDPTTPGWSAGTGGQPGQPGGYPTEDHPGGGYPSGYPGGYAPAGYPPQFYAPQRPTNGLAVASMIVSICSLVMCQPIGLVGAILGHKARKQVRERNEEGEGFATAGIIVGWIALAIGLLVIAFYAVFLIFFLAAAPWETTSEPTFN